MSREYIRRIILKATIETNETTYYFDYDEYEGIITGLQGLVDFLNNIFDTELLLCEEVSEE